MAPATAVFPGWDPALAATAAAATGGGWGQWPMTDGCTPYDYNPEANFYVSGGSWPCQLSPWEEGAQWPQAVGSQNASSPCRGFTETAMFGSHQAPDTPISAAASSGFPVGGRRSTGSGSEAEAGFSAAKACERTPATTAGSSAATYLQNPAEEDEDDRSSPVQVRLFTGDGAGLGCIKDPPQQTPCQVPLSALLEGPPGLCWPKSRGSATAE